MQIIYDDAPFYVVFFGPDNHPAPIGFYNKIVATAYANSVALDEITNNYDGSVDKYAADPHALGAVVMTKEELEKQNTYIFSLE